jgi:hypothetical protein
MLLRFAVGVSAVAATALIFSASASAANSVGGLDCNGYSPIQRPAKPTMPCTDVRGFAGTSNANTWDGQFYDNGHYVGHDEPDVAFLSNRRGSGNDVTWTMTIGRDPTPAPTVNGPLRDIIHWFELSPAPWFSMALCDPNSYPETNGCTPESDSNAPTCVGANTTNCYLGGDSTFMEMQLYPPGFPPFSDAISCDDSHYCAALTIDSLECTAGFATCNQDCEEPVNFAFVQRDGVPTGPAGPENIDLASETPNRKTLLMNPGDTIRIHMFDAPAPGGGDAFEVVINDLTTGQTGWMQASGANGFETTSPANCSGTPFNFQPEYSTASPANIVPWAADQVNISEAIETGHWLPCTSLSQPDTNDDFGYSDPMFDVCNGPYHSLAGEPQYLDSPCYEKGDTHSVLPTPSQPDTATGCLDFPGINGDTTIGDLDFAGPSYYADWPTSTWARQFPGAFVEPLPTTDGGSQYSHFFIQTDIGLSEYTCAQSSTAGCTVPPPGPGGFYPYWSRVDRGGQCALEFGNVSSGPGVDDMGKDAQYGADMEPTLGYTQFEGPIQSNRCGGGRRY